MIVFKTDPGCPAILFAKTDKGDNFDQAEKEAKELGLKLEKTTFGASSAVDVTDSVGLHLTLPVGYAAVKENGAWGVMSEDNFDERYVKAEAVSAKALAAKIDALEKRIKSIEGASKAGK